MRPSSPGLARAFAEGAVQAGADVTLIGLASTDQLYFASGHLGRAGAMFTASHNPAQYNGIKMCRAHAPPIGMETGLAEIRDRVASGETLTAATPGTLDEQDVLADYARYLLKLAPVTGRHLKVVVDAGNGMGGLTAPAVLGRIDVEVDAALLRARRHLPQPRGQPDRAGQPGRPAGGACARHGADIGLAFDGDADRCFLVDERGELVSPSVLTALIAARELAKQPGATIIHNLITSRAVPEIVDRARRQAGADPGRALLHQGDDGARPTRSSAASTPGTSTSATSGAPTPGCWRRCTRWPPWPRPTRRSRRCWRRTPGTSPAARSTPRWPTSRPSSTEIEADWARPARRQRGPPRRVDGRGTTDWWFNVRASNTEPLLRLNAEGKDEATMQQVRDEVLAAIRT